MPRPRKLRWISNNPRVTFFIPQNVPPAAFSQVFLTIDELEALRFADKDGLSQQEAAVKMNISRATFGRIVTQARRKVADALIYGKGIRITGGDVAFRPPAAQRHLGRGPHGPHGHGKGPWR